MPTDRLTEIRERERKGIRRTEDVPVLLAEIDRLRELAIFYGGLEAAPCQICGYNGPGYWQPSQHECARIWHDFKE